MLNVFIELKEDHVSRLRNGFYNCESWKEEPALELKGVYEDHIIYLIPKSAYFMHKYTADFLYSGIFSDKNLQKNSSR